MHMTAIKIVTYGDFICCFAAACRRQKYVVNCSCRDNSSALFNKSRNSGTLAQLLASHIKC